MTDYVPEPFPGLTRAESTDETRHLFRGSCPFKFAAHPDGGWLVATAYNSDATGQYLFGTVFHITDEQIPAFLYNSYSYFQLRIEKDLERSRRLREANDRIGRQRKPADPLAGVSLDIELKL